MRKNKIVKISRFLFVFVLIFSWIFSDWDWLKLPLLQAQEAPAGDTETIATESSEEETIENFSPLYIPPDNLPKVFARKPERNITIDRKATHSCETEEFQVDLSGRNSARVNLWLNRNAAAQYEAEILGLPNGIDIVFSKNQSQKYQLGGDNALEMNIQKTPNAQKGNFSVSFVFTQKGAKDSSVICQMNVINL